MSEEVKVMKMHQFLEGRRGRADSQLAGMPVYSSAARTPDLGGICTLRTRRNLETIFQHSHYGTNTATQAADITQIFDFSINIRLVEWLLLLRASVRSPPRQ